MLENNSESAAPPRGSAWHVEMLGRMRAIPADSGNPGNHSSESDPAVDSVEQFRTHKAALLLARLALLPDRAHAREELADLLWPEATTERGRANLSQTLMYLRQALHLTRSGDLFTADHKTVRVGKGLLTSDVVAWERNARHALALKDASEQAARLRTAIDAYTGDLLPGFYDEWVGVERLRLAAIRDDLLACLASLGDGAVTVSEPRTSGTPAASIAEPHAKPLGVANAPLYLTRFFGRDRECARALALFGQEPPVRLLTLLGMGGIGKTRLALRIAQLALEPCDEGTPTPLSFGWAGFVPLAEAFTAEQVEGLLLQGLGVPDEVADGLAAIVDRLSALAAQRSGRLLLLLDNLEQLEDTAAPIVARLLGNVPDLTILATSRQPVGIPGEREMPVVSLANVPDEASGSLPDDICLFIDRAALIKPEFALTAENQSDVTRLCALLEGIPLALELAAGWARVLSPGQIAARLGNRFDLLALHGGSRAVPKRHRSLHATIAWSYDLLGPAMQVFFTQLSVFRGGWTAEAAQAVTGLQDVSEPLLLLAERSMILVDEGLGQSAVPRYRMLESLREFADQQSDPEERAETRQRHGAYFLDLARAGEEAIRGPEQAIWLERLEREQDNLRAALARAIADRDAAFAQRLAGTLWSFWERRGYLREGRQWLEQAIALPGSPDTAERALALNRLGSLLNVSADLEYAADIHRQTLETYQRLGDERGIALVWNRLGFVARRRGDDEAARRAYTEALDRERVLGNRFNMAAATVNLGILAQSARDYETARERYGEATLLFQALENPAGIADALLNSATCLIAEDRYEESFSLLEQAAAIFARLGDRWSGAYVSYALSVVASRQDRWEEATRLADDALAVCREVGDRVKVADILQHQASLARQTGDRNSAICRLQEALAVHQELGQTDAQAECQRGIAALRKADALTGQNESYENVKASLTVLS